jgi:hypothetical protein
LPSLNFPGHSSQLRTEACYCMIKKAFGNGKALRQAQGERI